MASTADSSRRDIDDNHARLTRLAAIAPIFRDPKTIFGKWCPDGFGWFALSAVGSKFYEAVSADWFIADFDRPMWEESAEGQSLIRDRETIGLASCEQLAKLLSYLVTRERWDAETWKDAFETGLLLAITERAEALVKGNADFQSVRLKKPRRNGASQ